MIELLLINLFLDKETYLKYRFKINLSKEERELNTLYGFLDELMGKYNRTLSLEEFTLFVLSSQPDLQHLLNELQEKKVGHDLLHSLLKQHIERQQAYSLSLLSIDVYEGRKELSEVLDYVSSIQQEEENKTTEEFVTDDLEEIYKERRLKPGLRWRLDTLNKSLGSLRKGDFGFIFARPETGKTTFLASEITYMASQLKDEDGPILWFNNEEGGSKVKLRIMQAALKLNLTTLYSDRPKNNINYLKVTKEKIKLKDDAAINRRTVELLCKELKPSLILFDQIDKIKGFENDREDLRLGAIYTWAREIAKKHCPVIGVCQSDGSGENKKWLTMENVANAKTSKQAEADWILGIGTVHDEGLKYVRYLHLSKNKCDGDEDTVPEMRHGKMEVLIKPDVARYCDF